MLVDIGEVRALECATAATPSWWRSRSGQTLDLAEASLATSSASSLTFSNAQGLGHILHPATAATPGYWRSATVRHASAAIADGLSTALAIATPDQARHIVSATGGCAAWMQVARPHHVTALGLTRLIGPDQSPARLTKVKAPKSPIVAHSAVLVDDHVNTHTQGEANVEALTKSAARNIFYGGSGFFLLIFVALPYTAVTTQYRNQPTRRA